MKATCSFLGIISILIIIFSSCRKEQSDSNPIQVKSDPFQENARLKQILVYAKIDSQVPMGIVEEYEYDEKGRIIKTSSPMYDNGVITGTIKYNLYEYNSLDQLEKIRNFNANIYSPTGFINLQNYIYSYSEDGKKIKESVENLNGVISEYSVFEYEADKLMKTKKYSHNILESYTENQYDKSGLLIKESFYDSEGNCLSFTIHTYSGSLQVKSDLFRYQNGEQYRSIRRTFDSNKNLVTLESNELALYSSLMSFVFRYKYFE